MQRYFAQGEMLEREPTMSNVFRISFTKPDNIFALWRENGALCRMTYGEAREKVYAAAAELKKFGFAANACIGLKIGNSPDWGILFWATLMAGYRPVMMDPVAGPDYDEQIIRHTRAEAIITETPIPSAIPVILRERLLCGSGALEREEWADEIMFCSSGTSGERSVQVFDGRRVTAQILSARVMPEYSKDIMYPDEEGPLNNLALLPFHHVFGFVAVFLWYTFFQKTIVYPESLAPSLVASLAREAGVTHIFCVPLLWNGIAEQCLRKAESGKTVPDRVLRLLLRPVKSETPARFEKRVRAVPGLFRRLAQKQIFGDKVRFMISGGSYIDPKTLRVINALGYPLYNGYGLTEAGITSVELVPSAAARVRGSIGVPLTGVEYRLIDGALCLRAPQVSTGSMKDGQFVPVQTEDGWLDTGDTAAEKDGRLYIIGRRKELIITPAGENIAPELLESRLFGMEGVKNLCVLGLCMAGAGESVSLILELEDGLSLEHWKSIDARIKAENAKMPDYMRIRQIYVARSPIYMTNTMKIRRVEMKKDIESGVYKIAKLQLSHDFAALRYDVPKPVSDAVREAFSKSLTLDAGNIGADAHFMLELGGDSLSYAELICRLEERFGVEIPPEDYGACMSVEDFGQLMIRLGASI